MSVAIDDFATSVQRAILSPGYDEVEIPAISYHLGRYVIALELIRKIARPEMKVADVASYGAIPLALSDVLGFQDVIVTSIEGSDSDRELKLPPTREGRIFHCPGSV